jgi:RND family efflux transporter MFP subunit
MTRLAGLCASLLAASVFAQSTVAPVAGAQAPKPAVAPAEEDVVKGTTRCASDLSLAFPVTGRIADMRVREGSLVRVGQVLMSLDRAAEELDVERRRVQWEGQAELKGAQARMETARQQAEMARRIFQDSRGISLEELQNRELALATTVSELERIRTQKEMERLDYLTARENLERRALRAPSRGIVTRLIKHTGESVQANDAVLRLCDLGSIQFVANVPVNRSEGLREGNIVSLGVGVPAKPVRGKLIFVSPVVDSASGLREVKVELIKPGPEIRPGVPASLTLPK